LSVIVTAAMLTAAPAQAEMGLGYAVGAGTVLPVSSELSEILSPGIHLEGGVYFKVWRDLSVGPHITYDTTFGKTVGSFDHVGDFTGISARALYSGDAGIGRWWGSLGLGFYFGRLSTCGNNLCGSNKEQHLGLDVHVGFNFKVMRGLGIGPAIGVVYPNFNRFAEQILLTAAVRAHFGL